jgi:hypothetical protein
MLRAMKNAFVGGLAACVLTLCATLPAAAESFASSASSAGSVSVGSLSDSLTGSSDASSRGGKVAAGEYRIVAIAALPGDRQRLQLQAVADARQAFTLDLPLAAATLTVGEPIAVLDRAYGLAFARAAAPGSAPQPFFVALNDTWRGDLDLRRVEI